MPRSPGPWPSGRAPSPPGRARPAAGATAGFSPPARAWLLAPRHPQLCSLDAEYISTRPHRPLRPPSAKISMDESHLSLTIKSIVIISAKLASFAFHIDSQNHVFTCTPLKSICAQYLKGNFDSNPCSMLLKTDVRSKYSKYSLIFTSTRHFIQRDPSAQFGRCPAKIDSTRHSAGPGPWANGGGPGWSGTPFGGGACAGQRGPPGLPGCCCIPPRTWGR